MFDPSTLVRAQIIVAMYELKRAIEIARDSKQYLPDEISDLHEIHDDLETALLSMSYTLNSEA